MIEYRLFIVKDKVLKNLLDLNLMYVDKNFYKKVYVNFDIFRCY